MADFVPIQARVAQQRLYTSLGGLACTLVPRWNARAGLWYVDVLEVDDTPIALGLALTLGAKIGDRVAHPIFQGSDVVTETGKPALLLWDLSKSGREANFDDIGSRVYLVYLSATEVFMAGVPLPTIPKTPAASP